MIYDANLVVEGKVVRMRWGKEGEVWCEKEGSEEKE